VSEGYRESSIMRPWPNRVGGGRGGCGMVKKDILTANTRPSDCSSSDSFINGPSLFEPSEEWVFMSAEEKIEGGT